jgi:transposase
MRQKSIPVRDPAERVVKDIRRAMRRHFSAEDKIRIVLGGFAARTALLSSAAVRGLSRTSITGGRRNFSRLARSGWPVIRRGRRPPTRSRELRREASALKVVVAELTLENRLLKKSVTADGEDGA